MEASIHGIPVKGGTEDLTAFMLILALSKGGREDLAPSVAWHAMHHPWHVCN